MKDDRYTCRPGVRAYPPDLVRYVVSHWPADSPLTVPIELFEEAVACAFQASLTTEESRPTRLRLLLTRAENLSMDGEPNREVLRLLFDRARPLHADELRRLAPAAPFETALIGAHLEDSVPRIWGIAHSGPRWLAPAWGGRGGEVRTWTHDPIIHVTGPGQLAVRCAGKLIGAIERGVLGDATMDVFDSAWLPAMFHREREEIRALHAEVQSTSTTPTDVDHGLVGRIGQHMLRRCIQLIRGAQHGGMLLVVSDPASADGSRDGLRLKYRFQQDGATHRYRTLLLRILEALASSTKKPAVGWADFVASRSVHTERLEQAVFEWSRAIGNLAAIDGAVVLDKRFGLLGFGAEVSAELPSPREIWRALDAEGEHTRPAEIEAVGTRHRAAYRFINDHPTGLAIVISHDGGVSFVAQREGKIVFWEQSVGY